MTQHKNSDPTRNWDDPTSGDRHQKVVASKYLEVLGFRVGVLVQRALKVCRILQGTTIIARHKYIDKRLNKASGRSSRSFGLCSLLKRLHHLRKWGGRDDKMNINEDTLRG